jgi:glycosyltransferase involved in cell wall biosynthesis
MQASQPKIALLYDDDGYVEQPGQALQEGGTRLGLIGRQVAGKEFLDAYFSHGSWTELVALVRNAASAKSILHWCQNHPSSRTRRRGLRIVEEREFHRFFFPSPPATLIYNPCPPDARYAWARQHKSPGGYALSGVTHTLCSQRAIEWLCDLVTAPYESYDSLICTSRAVIDMVKAVTTDYADYLHDRHGGTARSRIRLEHIPLGVNIEQFHPASPEERTARRAQFQIHDNEVAVLFVGRLSHHGKAHPFPMFHGLAHAARITGQKIHLIISGWAANAPIMDAFQEGARALAPNIRVSFVDGTDPNVRFAVWQAVDIFTSLSDNIQETFGLVIVEAMASGLPVVASDWNGYRDLVVSNETGILVPTMMISGATLDTTSRLQMEEINYDHFLAECSQCVIVDTAKTAEAFASLIRDSSLRQRMGAGGRRRAEQLFAWPKIIKAYESLWAEQEQERLSVMRGQGAVVRGQETGRKDEAKPGRFADPEMIFERYPSRWLSGLDRFQTSSGAAAHLELLLKMPLTNHVAKHRCNDAKVLSQLLDAASQPCSISQAQGFLTKAGVASETISPTIAWMLKYDLLRVVSADLPKRSSDNSNRSRISEALGLQQQGRLADAVRAFREALAFQPDDVRTLIQLGMTLAALGNIEEARLVLEKSKELSGNTVEGLNNLALALSLGGRHQEAVERFREALKLQPDHAEVHWNLSLALLAQGKFEEGWREYEWRLKSEQLPKTAEFSQPRWDGSPLAGRTILLHAEQGLGDTLQFIRYASSAKERGGNVLALVPKALKNILSRTPGIDHLIGAREPLPEFSCHAPLLSLPHILGTTLESIPAKVPYLFAESQLVDEWRTRLAPHKVFRVGIAWQGNPQRAWDHPHRSIPLAEFEPLSRVEGVRLISLQKGLGADQLRGARFPVATLDSSEEEVAGAFTVTAAIMKNLDLVVTSDTALAHLAGALGVPVWLALSCAPDWRWLLVREDSPWYPTMRLFRQKTRGDWQEVSTRMADELRTIVATESTEDTERTGRHFSVTSVFSVAPNENQCKALLVEISPGELLDKISILEIKNERITDEKKRDNVQRELALLRTARDRSIQISEHIILLADQLKTVNSQLWDVEDSLRSCERERDFGPRFVELARSVYRHNDRRAAIKRMLNDLLGSRIIEEKSYPAGH